MSVVPPANDQHLYISPSAKVGVPVPNVGMCEKLEGSEQRGVQQHHAPYILKNSTGVNLKPKRRSLCNICEAAMAGELRPVTVVSGLAVGTWRPTST